MLSQSRTDPGLIAPVEPAWQQAPQDRAAARVDADHQPLAVNLSQLDLVCSHQPDADHVDDVTGQKVVCEQKLARVAARIAGGPIAIR